MKPPDVGERNPQEPRVLVPPIPPPDAWEWATDGRPTWIRAGDPWATLHAREPLIELPAIRQLARRRARQGAGDAPLGRRSLATAEPELTRLAAWMHDLGAASWVAIGAELERRHRRLPGTQNPKKAEKARTIRYVTAGRSALGAAGVWPWTVWTLGKLPPGWWLEDDAGLWLALWETSAAGRITFAPEARSA